MRSSKRVLIIDPNRISGQVHSETLRSGGIYTVSVPTAQRAFQLLKKSDFDIILTDIVKELYEMVKIFSRISKSKVLLFTSVCNQEVLSECLRRGIDGYIIKSHVSADEFVHLIQAYEVS